jgi:polyketide cyclase/dehydrase/lipid transport protein
MNVAPDAGVDIDRNAPVISHEEMLIEARLDVLWDLHTDVSSWPSWRPDVSGAELDVPFAIGSSFQWQTAGLDITSVISQIDIGSRTTWGGPANGIDGVHVWEFSETGRGVLVRTRESWSGEPVRANVDALQSALDESLRAWLRDLRDEAARRSHH